jgi:hypothetical protein
MYQKIPPRRGSYFISSLANIPLPISARCMCGTDLFVGPEKGGGGRDHLYDNSWSVVVYYTVLIRLVLAQPGPSGPYSTVPQPYSSTVLILYRNNNHLGATGTELRRPSLRSGLPEPLSYTCCLVSCIRACPGSYSTATASAAPWYNVQYTSTCA